MLEKSLEMIAIGEDDIREVYDKYPISDADIVALGCPHCSKSELTRLAGLLEGRKVEKELWICTARRIAEACPEEVSRIERSGARVICDTCMVVSPASERFGKMASSSGKALAYIPGLVGIKAGLGSTEECIRAVTVPRSD